MWAPWPSEVHVFQEPRVEEPEWALPPPRGVLVPLFILQAVLLSEEVGRGHWAQLGLAVHLEQGCP